MPVSIKEAISKSAGRYWSPVRLSEKQAIMPLVARIRIFAVVCYFTYENTRAYINVSLIINTDNIGQN
jgi:hypothetical protein